MMEAFHRLRSIFGSGIDIFSESITHRNRKRHAVVSDGRSSPILLPRVRTSFLADQVRNQRNASLLTEQRLRSNRAVPDSDEEEEVVDPNYDDQFTVEQWNKGQVFQPVPWPRPGNELEKAVLTAAASGDWPKMKHVWKEQSKAVNEARNEFGWQPLHFASYNGHLKMVQKLHIKCKCQPDEPAKYNWTPVFLAAWGGHVDVVKYLLKDANCDVKIRDVDGRDLFFACSWSGNMELVKWFAEEYEATPTLTKSGESLLIAAAEGGSIALFDWLVENYQLGADQWSESGRARPLGSAVLFGHLELSQHLVKKYKCSLSNRDKLGFSLLHSAAASGNTKLIEWLMIAYPFDVECRGVYNGGDEYTPVCLAARVGNADAFHLLLKYGANPMVVCGSWTPLHYACYGGCMELTKEFLCRGLDPMQAVTTTPLAGYNCLHLAVVQGHTAIVNELITKYNCAITNVKSEAGESMAVLAACSGNCELMQVLVDDLHCSAEDKSMNGTFPLLAAAYAGHVQMVELLLDKYKCSANEVYGVMTPVLCAAMKGHSHIVKSLVDHNADWLYKTANLDTALHLAADSGDLDTVNILIPLFWEMKFELNDKGQTCLHKAVQKGHMKVMRHLISQCGFDPNLKDASGSNCVQLAAEGGHTTMVKELLEVYNCEISRQKPEPDGAFEPLIYVATCSGKRRLVELLIDQYNCSPEEESSEGAPPLMAAVAVGSLPLVKLFLEKYNCRVNVCTSDHQWTPVLGAAYKGYYQILKVLVELGGNYLYKQPNDEHTVAHVAGVSGNVECFEYLFGLPQMDRVKFEMNSSGRTCLHVTVEWGHKEAMNYLIDKCGFDPNLQDAEGYTCFTLACYAGKPDIARELITKHKVNVHTLTEENSTAVHLACLGGHKEVVKMLVDDFSFPVNVRDKSGYTAFHYAAFADREECLALLVSEYHVNPNETDNNGMAALHFACAAGKANLVKYMMSNCNPDLDVVSKDGYTSLHIAARKGHTTIVKDLLKHGAEATRVQSVDGESMTYLAALSGSCELMELLVDELTEFGFSPEDSSTKSGTPLIGAADSGNLAMVKLLLDKYHCNIHASVANKWTPVLCAAYSGHYEVLKVLVEHGGDALFVQPDLNNALHSAAISGNLDCVKYLVPLLGDKRFATNGSGSTCLSMACGWGHLEVVEYLIEECALDPEQKNFDGLNGYLLACISGKKDIIEALICKYGVNKHAVNKNGAGAVHLVSRNGNIEIVQMLVEEFGLSVDIKDKTGRTALDYAATSECRRFLQMYSTAHQIGDEADTTLQSFPSDPYDFNDLNDALEAPSLSEESWDANESLDIVPEAHESMLQKLCWIPFDFQTIFVTTDGGVFALQPNQLKGLSDEALIQLHVPQGAVPTSGIGFAEIRYAILPVGPFQLPDGYRLCSMVVYICLDTDQICKPVYLLLPHWCAEPNQPCFIMSPHRLQPGNRVYQFDFVEGGEFDCGYGIVEIDGHSSLFAEACELEDTSCYLASLWQRKETEQCETKRVAVTFCDSVWIEILNEVWGKTWTSRFDPEPLMFEQDALRGDLEQRSGRGWTASAVGAEKVTQQEVQAYLTRFKTPERLERAVKNRLYPPSIAYRFAYTHIPVVDSFSLRMVNLNIDGTHSGRVSYPCDVYDSPKDQAPMVTGANVAQSRKAQTPEPKAGVFPVHSQLVVSASPERTPAVETEPSQLGIVQTQAQDHTPLALMGASPETSLFLPIATGVHLLDTSALPTLPEIQILVLTEASGKWYQLATMLEVDPCVIDIILKDCPSNAEVACLQMLTRWLNHSPNTGRQPRTWKTLLSALLAIGKRQFVENLIARYFKSHH